MKTISVEVSDPVYEELQIFAQKAARKTSELIQDAIEEYRRAHIAKRGTSLRDRRPASVGGPIQALHTDDDILAEMLDDARS